MVAVSTSNCAQTHYSLKVLYIAKKNSCNGVVIFFRVRLASCFADYTRHWNIHSEIIIASAAHSLLVSCYLTDQLYNSVIFNNQKICNLNF